ncbi:hypothetical protein [Blastococcus xanthinilyticus]|uniref:Uncharacterized protein n=1 Tax=Blastococcus xanthinilyticus TaxID=1564164 RepID=A0A5S5D0V9_9ACTN|nr:hypothetical protein [Blastococcus xanthinilyticus]TYP89651.1 hypothetical protein BD833_102124 [Blastococcus xanthinilyticus]
MTTPATPQPQDPDRTPADPVEPLPDPIPKPDPDEPGNPQTPGPDPVPVV